jgi:ATP-dependent Clp protease ATP-binding subunit ClpB
VWEALRGHFRPEFLNRVDEVIIFNALGRAQIKHIVDIQMQGLEKRLAERGITLELSDAAKEAVAEEGYDPVYGARPLKRAIQTMISDPLARKVLSGEYAEGDVVRVDVGHEGQLLFKK